MAGWKIVDLAKWQYQSSKGTVVVENGKNGWEVKSSTLEDEDDLRTALFDLAVTMGMIQDIEVHP